MTEPSQGGSGGSWFEPRRSAEPGSSVLGDAQSTGESLGQNPLDPLDPLETPAASWDAPPTPDGFTAETQEFPPPPPGFTPEPQTFGGDTPGFVGATPGFVGDTPGFTGEPLTFTTDTQGFGASAQGFAADTQGFTTDTNGFRTGAQGLSADTQAFGASGVAGTGTRRRTTEAAQTPSAQAASAQTSSAQSSSAQSASAQSPSGGADADEPGAVPEPGPPTPGFGYWDSEEQLPPPPPDEPPSIHKNDTAQAPAAQDGEGGAQKTVKLTQRPQGVQGTRRYRHLRNQGLWNPHRSAPPKATNAPPRSERSNTNFVLLIVASTVAALLVAGGVDMAQGGDDEGGDAGAGQDAKPEAGAPAGERPDGGADPANGAGNAADRKAFAGTWQSERGEKLTVKAKPGRSGKQPVSYDRTGKLSTCPGVGQVRKSGKTFRLALRCDNGDVRSELGGDAVRADGKLTVEWDGGTRDTFTKEGARERSKLDSSGGRIN